MPTRVILVQRLLDGEQCMLHELRALAEAAGYEVVSELTQKRAPDSRYNIGRGKVEELRELISKDGGEQSHLLQPAEAQPGL
jgi:GTPases